MRSASLDEIRRNVCATIACRAAIKINTSVGTNENRVAAARACGLRVSDDLPARPAHRAALQYERYFEELP